MTPFRGLGHHLLASVIQESFVGSLKSGERVAGDGAVVVPLLPDELGSSGESSCCQKIGRDFLFSWPSTPI